MYQFVNVIIIIVIVLLLLNNKKGFMKFSIKHYLSSLNEQDKNIVSPYLKGAFVLGMMIPLLFWIIGTGFQLLEEKIEHKRLERLYAYKIIGYCYVDKKCRDIVVNNPVQTDEDITKLTEQIRQYMVSNMKSGNKNDETK